ncbi:Receptor-interacting serine/threonine-protein kinase 3 [Blastocladiella emersonii ATCC 22665]|nr:Receptor-interacting serine/threonine-protein kinase 3 [Blastocladiella emersonii ATCC 22665]
MLSSSLKPGDGALATTGPESVPTADTNTNNNNNNNTMKKHEIKHAETRASVEATLDAIQSDEAKAQREKRRRRAERQARINHVVGHAATGVSASALSALGEVKPHLADIKELVDTKELAKAVAAYHPATYPIVAFIEAGLKPYMKLVKGMQRELSRTLDLANEIERRSMDILQLCGIVLEVYADPAITKIISKAQEKAIVKLIGKIDGKVRDATVALEELDNSGNVRLMLSGQSKELGITLGQVNATIMSAQSQLHAHVSSSMLALLNHQGASAGKLKENLATQTGLIRGQGDRIDALARIAKDLAKTDAKMDAALRGTREAVAAVDNRAGFWKAITNPGLARLWGRVVGLSGGGMVCTADDFLMTLEDLLTDRVDAWIGLLTRGKVPVTLADLGYTTPASDGIVTVSAIEALFPHRYAGSAEIADLLGWRAFAWVPAVNDAVRRIDDLAASAVTFRAAALAAQNVAQRLAADLKAAWGVKKALERKLGNLRIQISPAITSQCLPPKYAALADALDAVARLLAEGQVAAATQSHVWTEAPEQLAVKYAGEIGAQLGAAAAAALAMGLPKNSSAASALAAYDAAKVSAQAEAAMRAETEVFDQMLDLTFGAEDGDGDDGGALAARSFDAAFQLSWDDLTATTASRVDAQQHLRTPHPWGLAQLYGAEPVMVSRYPAKLVRDGLGSVAIQYAHAPTQRSLLRVYGVLPPSPATNGDWAVVSEPYELLGPQPLDSLDLLGGIAVARAAVSAAAAIRAAQLGTNQALFPQLFDEHHLVAVRNALGQLVVKLVPPGLDTASTSSISTASGVDNTSPAAATLGRDAARGSLHRASLSHNSLPRGVETAAPKISAIEDVDALFRTDDQALASFVARVTLDAHPAPARPTGFPYATPIADSDDDDEDGGELGARAARVGRNDDHPGDVLRDLRRHLARRVLDGTDATSPTSGSLMDQIPLHRQLLEDLDAARATYRAIVESPPSASSVVLLAADGLSSSSSSLIDFDALPKAGTAARINTEDDGQPRLSADEAMRKYYAARATIRGSRGPLTQPDFDVNTVYHSLIAAGQSGHQPMALVAAADLFYYGAIPRGPDSWRVAMRLYHTAAEQGARYAHVGLGDLLFFNLVEDPRSGATTEQQPRSRTEILAVAAEQYELAHLAVIDPATRALLLPREVARVECGLGDVLFERAQLAAAAGNPALADELWRRARPHYHEAKDADPRCKRAFARLALYSLHGYGGETKSVRAASVHLASARSTENPMRSLTAQLETCVVIDDMDHAAHLRAEIAGCTIPDH